MNRPLRHIAVFCGLLVLALLVRATWVQFVQGEELAGDANNRRVKIEAYSYPRGNIIVGGKPITGSVATPGDFRYKRTFKDGPMYAPITGYASQAQGPTGSSSTAPRTSSPARSRAAAMCSRPSTRRPRRPPTRG
jgi:hypothetical protein